MNKREYAKINPSSCETCIHKPVCSYKQDFLDIYNAVAKSTVMKQIGSQGMNSKNVVLYDILGEIVIKCKHYYEETPTPRYQDSITTLTNPCDIDISSTTSAKNPHFSLETTADYIFR